MAQYDNVSGVARKMVKKYENVSGVARKVVKSYENVSGVARRFFNTIVSPLYLYNRGDKCTTVSGGWSQKGATNGPSSGYASTPSVGFGNTRMTVYQAENHHAGYVYTLNKINLTQYSQLCAEISLTGENGNSADSGGCSLIVFSSTDGTNLAPYLIKSQAVSAKFSGTATLDISDVAGEYYVGIWMVSSRDYEWYLNIDAVYLND